MASIQPLNPQSWNRYSYVINNPLRFNDPDGKKFVDETGQKLRDEVIEKGNDDEVAAVKALDAEEEEVTTVETHKAAFAVVDEEGELVEGSVEEVEAENLEEAMTKAEESVPEGHTVVPLSGLYEPMEVDPETGEVTKSQITLYHGSMGELKHMEDKAFAHEAEHGRGPGTRNHADFAPGIYQQGD